MKGDDFSCLLSFCDGRFSGQTSLLRFCDGRFRGQTSLESACLLLGFLLTVITALIVAFGVCRMCVECCINAVGAKALTVCDVSVPSQQEDVQLKDKGSKCEGYFLLLLETACSVVARPLSAHSRWIHLNMARAALHHVNFTFSSVALRLCISQAGHASSFLCVLWRLSCFQDTDEK